MNNTIMEFNTQELIEYFKNRPFQFTDSSKITDVEIESETYNPFDTSFCCKLKFNNNLLIDIDKEKLGFKIRVGKDNGWIGGLMYTSCEEVFYIDTLDFKSLKDGFNKNYKNQLYSLVSKHGTNSVNEIIKVGTLDELKRYCLNLSYSIKSSGDHYQGTFKEHYFFNYHLGKYDSNKFLYILAL